MTGSPWNVDKHIDFPVFLGGRLDSMLSLDLDGNAMTIDASLDSSRDDLVYHLIIDSLVGPEAMEPSAVVFWRRICALALPKARRTHAQAPGST